MAIADFNLSGRIVARQTIALTALSALAMPVLAGDIDSLSMFRNVSSQQTGDGATLADAGAFVSITANTLGAASYGGATVEFPGPLSPQTLTALSPTNYGFQTATLPSKAAMDVGYPSGTYLVTLDDGVSPVQAQLELGADQYALSRPYLSGSGWSALQGMNAGAAMTVPFSPFVTNPAAVDAFIFFTIYDYTAGQWAYDAGFLSAASTSVTLPANLLAAGHLYAYELDFSSRAMVPGAGANFDPQVGYELRTFGLFASAVPEPGAWLLLLAGAGALGLRRRIC